MWNSRPMDTKRHNSLLTAGDMKRDDRFSSFTRRQIEYAIERSGISPVGRVGIIRMFSVDQAKEILDSLHRTTRRGRDRPSTSGAGGSTGPAE